MQSRIPSGSIAGMLLEGGLGPKFPADLMNELNKMVQSIHTKAPDNLVLAVVKLNAYPGILHPDLIKRLSLIAFPEREADVLIKEYNATLATVNSVDPLPRHIEESELESSGVAESQDEEMLSHSISNMALINSPVYSSPLGKRREPAPDSSGKRLKY